MCDPIHRLDDSGTRGRVEQKFYSKINVRLDGTEVFGFRYEIVPASGIVFDHEPFLRTDTELIQYHENRVDVHDDVSIEVIIIFGNTEHFLD
jgi:hypothetical protein